MGKRGPASPDKRIRDIGKEISTTNSLNDSHKAAIEANLALLQNDVDGNREKAKTLSESIKYLLGNKSLRNILLAYLAFDAGPYKFNKDTRQKKNGQVTVQNLKYHFENPVTLDGSSKEWVSRQFEAISHDVKPDEDLISAWLRTMTPGEETLFDVLNNLKDGMQIGVCQKVLESQITKLGLVDLHSKPKLSAGWDGHTPRLIRGGAGQFFPDIESTPQDDDFAQKLVDITTDMAKNRGKKSEVRFAAYRLKPGADSSEKLRIEGTGSGWLHEAFNQCRSAPKPDEPRIVAIDAIWPGSMLRMPKFVVEEALTLTGGGVSPNMTPRLVLAPTSSFTDVHIDSGSHGLAVMAPGVSKLWGLWPGTEKNIGTLSRLKCQAAAKALEKGATDADFVLPQAVEKLDDGIWVVTDSLDLLHMRPGTIHTVYTMNGGILAGCNFVSADDMMATARAVDTVWSENEARGKQNEDDEFGYFVQALQLL